MKKLIEGIIAIVMVLMIMPTTSLSAVEKEVLHFETAFNDGAIITGERTYMGYDGMKKELPDGWRYASEHKGNHNYSDGAAIIILEDEYEAAFDALGKFPADFRLFTYAAINTKGEILFEIKAQDLRIFSDGLAATLIDGRWNYVDKTGETVIVDVGAEYVGPFEHGVAGILSFDVAMGAINKEGDVIIPCGRYISTGSNGVVLALNETLEKYVFVDKAGEKIIQEEFDSAGNFREGLALVTQGELTYFINAQGKTVFEMPQGLYTETPEFSDGVLLVSNSDAEEAEGIIYSYLDKTGKVVLTLPKGYLPGSFHEGLALVHFMDNSSGYINKAGETLIRLPEDATNAGRFNEGHAVYYTQDGSGNLMPHIIKNPLRPFVDIDKHWAMDDIIWMYEKGYINGVTPYTFQPGNNLSRAELVTLLYRMDNSPSASSSSFEDVAAGSYYASAVAWAQGNGIVNGTSDTKFSPNLSVTREQMATILMRYVDYKGDSISSYLGIDASSFDDYNTVSGYAKEAMDWSVKSGLISGKGDTKLDPKGVATRAETAAILHRFLELDVA